MAELEHQYVLRPYGTVPGFGPFRALVFPWMPNGTLIGYLNRADSTLTMTDRLSMVCSDLRSCDDNLLFSQ